MHNQIAVVARPDIYGQAAKKFLQLLPSSCIAAEKLFLESIKSQTTSAPQPSSFPGTPNRVASSPPPPPLLTSSPLHTAQLEKPKPLLLNVPAVRSNGVSTNPFDASLPPSTPRSRSGSNGSSTGSLVSISSGQQLNSHTPSILSAASKDSMLHFEYIPPPLSYMRSLLAAREAIATCAARCRSWSNSYDKCLEDSSERQCRRSSDTVKSSEMEDVRVENDASSKPEREEESLTKLSAFRTRSVTVSSAYRLPLARARERESSGTGRIARSQGREEEATQKNATTQPLTRSPRLSRRSEESRFEDRTGLLLKVLMDKLSEMLTLTPTVNVLLTRVLSRLAHYPQPLLRSLLLNHQLVLRPGVPNLYYVSALHVCTILHVHVSLYSVRP